MPRKNKKQTSGKVDWSKFDFTGIWRAVADGLEAERKRHLQLLVKSGVIDPEEVGQLLRDYAGTPFSNLGRTFEQRFCTLVGRFSSGEWPAFKEWWNLMTKEERWLFRQRHHLGGTKNQNFIRRALGKESISA